MKAADSPRAGWYPDPTGRAGLRWWDGLDWTDHRRAPLPSRAWEDELTTEGGAPSSSATPTGMKTELRGAMDRAPRSAPDTTEIMAEVRKVARDEVDRAVNLVTQRASDATRRIEPLISQYGDRVMRWIRNIGIITIALVVLWMVLQTFAQTSLLNWIGDRVDNLTGGTVRVPQRLGLPTWWGSNP